MFDGVLDVYAHKMVHIDIKPDVQPYHMPCIHLATSKIELDHVICLGVLKPHQESKWASPSFIVPKKDGKVSWISDTQQLDKVIK